MSGEMASLRSASELSRHRQACLEDLDDQLFPEPLFHLLLAWCGKAYITISEDLYRGPLDLYRDRAASATAGGRGRGRPGSRGGGVAAPVGKGFGQSFRAAGEQVPPLCLSPEKRDFPGCQVFRVSQQEEQVSWR